jgi:hypothetical protein
VSRPVAYPLALLPVLLLVGCGGSPPAVSGVVTLDGNPVEGAMVRFHEEGAVDEPGFVAITQKDGTFRLPAASAGTSGLRPGKHVVTVAKFKTGIAMMRSAKEAAPEASAFPAVYADPKRSPFRYDFTGGEVRVELKMEGGKK